MIEENNIDHTCKNLYKHKIAINNFHPTQFHEDHLILYNIPKIKVF